VPVEGEGYGLRKKRKMNLDDGLDVPTSGHRMGDQESERAARNGIEELESGLTEELQIVRVRHAMWVTGMYDLRLGWMFSRVYAGSHREYDVLVL